MEGTEPYCGESPLWNTTLLLNSSWPQFTACFQSSVLVIVPNGLLWVAMLVYLPYIIARPSVPPVHFTWTNTIKTIISVLLSISTLLAILTESGFGDEVPYFTAHYVARFIEGVTYLSTAALVQIERSCGVVTSGVLFLYWLLLAVVDVVPLYSYIAHNFVMYDPIRAVIFYAAYLLIVVQVILHGAWADTPRDHTPAACPETTATFLSRITYWWMTRLIITGYRKPLDSSDLWRLNPRDESATVVPKFEKALEAAVGNTDYREFSISDGRFKPGDQTHRDAHKSTSANNNRTGDGNDEGDNETMPLIANGKSGPSYKSTSRKRTERECNGHLREEPQFSLLRLLLKTHGYDVLLSYICKFCSDILQYASPVLLGLLINQIQSTNEYEWRGYALAGFMLVASWSQSSFYHQHFHTAMTTGMRMKTTLMAAIYKKSMLLSTEGQRDGTVGEVVNMMSVDCQRVQDMMSYTWMVWSIPLQVLIAVYLLWDTLGTSVLAGVGLLLLLMPVNGYLAVRQQRLQKQNLQWKDKRLKIMNEVISGIKVLKLYAWETSFHDKVMELRNKEITVLKKVANQNAFSIFIWTCAPFMVTLATFATYVLVDVNARLDAHKAFVTLSLFNILQFPIAFVPEMISFTAQASVSIKRIEKFLKLGEIDPEVVTRNQNAESAVRIERGLFTWDVKGRSTLHGVNLDIAQGELVAVVGCVGSGKSSLISAILGEMERLQGKVTIKGSVAYVPQQAWIQNASVKDNILFGNRFDAKRYKKTLDACALAADLEILQGGDQTEIGEKGINLSGGQKQRVSLARAVYANRDVYILDDPLSAVDSSVGKHLFRKIISDRGVLKHKTRILVTHAVQWLPMVDKIVLMHEGRIVEAGSYLQLMRRDGPLAQYLHAVLVSSEDTDTESDPEVREIIKRIKEHVESETSTSDGGTSGDEFGFYSSNRFLSSSARHAEFLRRQGNQNEEPPAARLTEEEQAATGKVKMKVFLSYIRHLGPVACTLIMLMFSLYQTASVYANFWLADWTLDPVLTSSNSSADMVADRNQFFLTYYGLLGVLQAIFILMYAWLAARRMTLAAANMHSAMLDTVMRSPMSFFDTTPSGRIVNRFARDIETVDNTLPQIMFMFVMCIFSVATTLVVISVSTPLFMAVIVPLLMLFYALQRFFVPTTRQLKRLEAVTRSPIFAHFSETLAGASVIRAYQATSRFIQESLERIDKNQVFYFAGITANRWLGIWVEVISSCVVFAAAVFAILTPDLSGAQAGLSLSYALQITQALKWLVRTISDFETNVVSVERLQEYSELKSEAPRVTSLRPRRSWPTHGNIIFTNYSTRYRPGLDLVIKDLNINIKGGEKVGIVGRTGAGKSSLTLSLFRLIEPSAGTITIDGLDTTSLGTHDLRSRLTILPQDPVLFSGSLRMNLDPFGQFSDRELWECLELAHLLWFVRELPDGLEYDCGEGGRNLSVGQRQLVCLARGLLRKTRILVLDEPTAAVDPETDILIQGTIRRDFAVCTTITIAHRLNTIMDYDRVLVLDDGRVREFDSPNVLLHDKKSLFYSLASDAGLVA